MAANPPVACGACAGGLCGGKGLATLKEGAWTSNPISIQILGICSALAVTNRLENALVMGAALVFVTAGTNLLMSLLRKSTPRKVRMMAEMAVIATLVIAVDQLLKAFYFGMSVKLGPYVGLIITNCIIMGRAEAFALQNRPVISMVDGMANGLGYAGVLAIIAVVRELLGNGTLLERPILSANWYTPNLLMILAPGAFIALGVLVAVYNAVKGEPKTAGAKPGGAK